MRLTAAGSLHKFFFSDVVEVEGMETMLLDITDLDAVRAAVSACKIDAIVNCAAYTNVDAAEANGELAEKLNIGMAANALTKYLNIKHGRLKDEYGTSYENKAKHSGRRVTLTLMPLDAAQ